VQIPGVPVTPTPAPAGNTVNIPVTPPPAPANAPPKK
jgi:hypothetical protein